MRAKRRRAKKLIVAFHFQYANQAAWKCDDCRKRGLEIQRQCGWLREQAQAGKKCVWSRESVAITSCPVSYISPESVSFLEEFHAWKLFGCPNIYELPARAAEAFYVLETELRSEYRRAQR
jgi:hypothetical protein